MSITYGTIASAFTPSIIMGDSNESQSSTSSSVEWSQPCRQFEFPEILLATDNFNESLVIGHGGFGKVFKGNITNGSGVIVAAIKRLDSMSSQGASEFWAEVEMLSKLRHCHLVSLFGYCNHEQEMILIYEYMPNGTLEDHLHKLSTPLSWVQRLKICIGTARGLDYLHTGAGIEFGVVIHRDVKSSNILLHESWAAKVSDFGLSKISSTNKSSTHVSTLVKGTFGYFDPNYYTTGRLTRKSDVYSFGVILLEVLCRKRAVDRSIDDEQWGLVPWAQESIKEGNLKNIIDYGIRGQISPKCLKEFIRIAERCLHINPKKRPTMAEVVVGLDSCLTLQQTTDRAFQAMGKTIYEKMREMLPFSFHGENSAHDDSRLSSNSKEIKDSIDPIPRLKVFNFSDLEMATRNFCQDSLIGKDDYGEVFLGWVDKNTFAPSTQDVGIPVAVRKYSKVPAEWKALVTSYGQVAHPNIISLLGYCYTETPNLLLVYEYTHTHKQNFSHFLFDVFEPLSWETRLTIMIGVARGLAYMHSLKRQVIHGGIETYNVFLDKSFNAKLGYFDVAKFRLKSRNDMKYITKSDMYIPRLKSRNDMKYITKSDMYIPKFGGFDDTEDVTESDMDTVHYVDRGNQPTGKLTVKSDIYSFGVVLFETLTRKEAQEQKFGLTLVKWVRPFLADKNKLKYIIDHRLNQNYPLEGAFDCAALATRCVAEDPEARPSSEEVLKSLEHIMITYKK